MTYEDRYYYFCTGQFGKQIKRGAVLPNAASLSLLATGTRLTLDLVTAGTVMEIAAPSTLNKHEFRFLDKMVKMAGTPFISVSDGYVDLHWISLIDVNLVDANLNSQSTLAWSTLAWISLIDVSLVYVSLDFLIDLSIFIFLTLNSNAGKHLSYFSSYLTSKV